MSESKKPLKYRVSYVDPYLQEGVAYPATDQGDTHGHTSVVLRALKVLGVAIAGRIEYRVPGVGWRPFIEIDDVGDN